jgi:hypothetical protein
MNGLRTKLPTMSLNVVCTAREKSSSAKDGEVLKSLRLRVFRLADCIFESLWKSAPVIKIDVISARHIPR